MHGYGDLAMAALLPSHVNLAAIIICQHVCYCYPCRRPTFRPSMKLEHQPPKSLEAGARRATLAAYINALADLAAPKKALPILSDSTRLDAFDAGIKGALQQKPGEPQIVPSLWSRHLCMRHRECNMQQQGRAFALRCVPDGMESQALLALLRAGAHVLVLGAGTGVLPLMAAGAGAGSVTAVERTRMLYRMARQVLGDLSCLLQLIGAAPCSL